MAIATQHALNCAVDTTCVTLLFPSRILFTLLTQPPHFMPVMQSRFSLTTPTPRLAEHVSILFSACQLTLNIKQKYVFQTLYLLGFCGYSFMLLIPCRAVMAIASTT